MSQEESPGSKEQGWWITSTEGDFRERATESKMADLASFAFSLHSNTPGALLKALECIANLGLNMNRIESRPSKRELGEYIFFVDIDLTNKVIDIEKKLSPLLQPYCENISYFGSYKNSQANLL